MEKKKFDVEFHGTNLFALVPLLLFVVFCILFFVVFKTFDMMHLCMGGYVALIIGSLLSKNWGKYWDAVATGMSSKIMNELALILLIVGMFGKLMTRGGVAQGFVWLGDKIGLSGGGFVAFTFIATCVIATATGTSIGPAIIMWGPIANDLGKSKGLHPYRRANLMDGFGSTLPAVIPVTSAFIFIALSCIQGLMDTYSFVQEVSPVSLAGASLHCWFLFVALAVAVITGWGRKYEGPNGEPVKALPAQTK